MLYYFENSVVGTLRLLFSNFVISELGGIACIRCTSMVQSLLAHYFLFFEAPHSMHLIRFFLFFWFGCSVFALVWYKCPFNLCKKRVLKCVFCLLILRPFEDHPDVGCLDKGKELSESIMS